jgi:hypothetical protein
MAMTSLRRYAIRAAASLPSTVMKSEAVLT